jgi:hypothetical protein
MRCPGCRERLLLKALAVASVVLTVAGVAASIYDIASSST